MRGSVRALAGFGVLSIAAVRLLACGGEDPAAPPDPFASFDADLPERDLGPDPDADNADTQAPVDPPSFCNGIVFYASLDGTYAPERSGTPATTFGNAQLVSSGKFGGAASFFEDGGAGDGASAYYTNAQEAGVPWYPNAAGTVSLWYRGTVWSDFTGTPVLWRVMAALPPSVNGGGIALVSTGAAGQFGLINVDNGTQTNQILVFPRSAIRPYVNEGDYNHFVSAWSRGDASTPTAVLMVNGGTGKIFDASVDAPSYADAQPDDAGDLLVPYRATRARPWDSDASAFAFRLGGTGASASDGEIDDVVVWNRVLSLSEMEALYAANAPVGTVCNLKK